MPLDRTQPGIAELYNTLQATILAGTTAQYYRGDKTWVSLPDTPTWSTLTGKPMFATVATSGAYSDLSGLPTLGTQMTVDSGWTANSTAGDKTAIIAAFTASISGTMITALNTLSAGLGTALAADEATVALLVKKVAALETVLVAGKLPNA